MLSTENPPDHSCSCKFPPLKRSDERAPPPSPPPAEPDPAPGLLGVTHPSHLFSIRDYVHTLRSKNIGTNWPFPQKYLQLCLKHGVRELLPPFELPDPLRAAWHHSEEGAGVSSKQQLVACSEGGEGTTRPEEEEEVVHPNNTEVRPSDQAQNPLSEEDRLAVDHGVGSNDDLKIDKEEEEEEKAEIESTVTSRDQILCVSSHPVGGLFHPVQESSSVGVESAKPPPSFLGKVESSCETSVKKCRLVVKFAAAVPETAPTEDIGSNSSSVISDPMASKVCPVCKTFSSTSNTTLNAHIDQCLSVESTAKQVATNFCKHKVKLRKKRTMVDVYATTSAPFTLEDLDRRNGTTWALDLTMMAAPATEGCTTQSKRPRPSPGIPVDDETEGPVYVDSNGTKLRILSKLNDAQPTAAAAQEPKPVKFRKMTKDARRLSFCKKKVLSSKGMKRMKVKQQSKKLGSFKPFKGEIRMGLEGNFHMDTHQDKGESVLQTSTVQDQVKVSEPGMLRKWFHSKHSGLSKRLNNKVSHRCQRNPVAITHDALAVGNQSVSGDSSASRNHILKLSRPSDDSLSPSKTKSIDDLSNPVHATDNGGKHSPSLPGNSIWSVRTTSSTEKGLMRKLPRTSGNYVSSQRSKGLEVHARIQNTTPRTSQSFHPLPQKAKIGSTPRKLFSIKRPSCPVEAIRRSEVEKVLIPKKLRKRRSSEKPGEHGEKLLSDADEGFHDSPIDLDLCLVSNNPRSKMYQSNLSQGIMRFETQSTVDQARKSNEVEKVTICKKLRNRRFVEKLGKHGEKLPSEVGEGFRDFHGGSHLDSRRKNQFNLSKNNMRPETQNTVDQVSPSPCKGMDAEQGKGSSNTMKTKAGIALENLQLEAECLAYKLANAHLQVQISTDVNTMIKYSLEKADGMSNTDEAMSSEAHMVATCDKVDPFPSLEEHRLPTGDRKASVGSSIPGLIDDQWMHCSETAGQNDHMGCQTLSREKDESHPEHQNAECHPPDMVSIEGSSACLTSSGDNVVEASHGNSSVTSVRVIPAEDHDMEIYVEPSESPVSAISIISHPSKEDVKLKDSESGPSVEPVPVQEKLGIDFSSKLALPPVGTRGAEGTHLEKRNKELTAIARVQESDKFWGHQPCCCLRRESISRETQPIRQNIIADVTFPSKTKQMTSNLSLRPVAPSPFGTRSMLRNEKVVNPGLDSSTDSVSLMTSLDPAVRFQTRADLGWDSPVLNTKTQSTSSPVLRLMGKNLMVVKKEEEPVLPQKQFVPHSSTANPSATCSSLVGFSPTCSVSNQGSILYRPHQFLENSMVMGNNPSNTHQVPPSTRIGSFAGTPLPIGPKNKPYPQIHQKRSNKKSSSTFRSNLDKVSLHHPHQKPVSATGAPATTREVIVIDDSSEPEPEQSGTLPSPASASLHPALGGSNLRLVRPFAGFPSQSPLHSRNPLPGLPRPACPIWCPTSSIRSPKQGIPSSEASGLLLSRPFMAPSLSEGHLATPSLYYSPGLR